MSTTNGNNVGSVTVNTVTKVSNTTDVTTTANANTVTISETAYMFIRPRTVTFSAQGLKPNTRYYPFFNGAFVAAYCSTVNNLQSSTLVTNSLGELVGNFYLPANTFVVGSHKFQLVDNIRVISGATIPDPIYGSAEASYEANGTLKLQQTQVTVNTIVNTNAVITSTTNVQVELPVVQCTRWYFEYAVYNSNDVIVFTVTSNSSTPPNNPQPSTGAVGTIFSSTLVGTTVGPNRTFYHTFAGRRTVATGGNVQVDTFRQEWIGVAGTSPRSLVGFRPSGIPPGSTVAVITPWFEISTAACPIDLGFGSPIQTGGTTSRPYDPLAQSFFIDSSTYPEGVFVTSIDVFFKTVDQSTPVILELRNMSNGSPGSNVFPGGRSILPGYAAAQSHDASVATTFRFDFPIFLQPNNEYCFVVRTTSMGYNCWCSRLGEIDVLTNKVIDTQPTLGTLFKSENNYTWIPDSYEDIKFDLNVAVFNTSKDANLIFRPQSSGGVTPNYFDTVQTLPMSYISTVKGSAAVDVIIPAHSLSNNDKIVITGTSTSTAVQNNIPINSLTGTHTVTVLDDRTVRFTPVGGRLASKSGPLRSADALQNISTVPAIIPPTNTLTPAVPVINIDNFSSPTLQPNASANSLMATVTAPLPPTVESDSSFNVYTNVQVNELMIDYMGTEFSQTNITELVSLATGQSSDGTETPYGFRNFIELPEKSNFYAFNEPRMIATPINEALNNSQLTGQPSATVNLKMSSNNRFISPVVDLNGMSLVTRTYVVNNQDNEINEIITTGGNQVTLKTNFNDPTKNSEVVSGAGKASAKYKGVINTSTEFYNKVTLFVTANCPSPAAIDAYVRTSADRETHMDRDWDWMPINGVYGSLFTTSRDKNATREWMYELQVDDPFNVYDIKLVMRSTNNSVVPKIYGVRAITNTI
jgi:hypothetical protein